MIKVSISPFPNCGLCNQLYYLASTFIDCLLHRRNEFMVYGMLQEINSHQFIPISCVLNLTLMNQMLPVKIVDGFRDKGPWASASSWKLLNDYPDLARKFYSHIRFSNQVIYPTRNMPREFEYMIHLRLETDAVEHWSRMNDMSQDDFKKRLEDWYMDAIDKNIPKGEGVLVLTGNKENRVWRYLVEAYKIYHLDKPGVPREVAAAMDLSMAQRCKKIFIGGGGSTFTEFIMTTVRPTGILCDLNHLDKIE